MADRRHDVTAAAAPRLRAALGGILAALALMAASAAAEEPRLHNRSPEKYQALPPLPSQSQTRRSTRATTDRFQVPGRFDDDPNDPEATPFKRQVLKPTRKVPHVVEEITPHGETGKVKLWNTNDPPDKRGVFAFQGNRIGDPITAMYPKPKEEKDQFGMLLCRETKGLPGFLDCADDSLRRLVDGVWQMRYRGAEIIFLSYRYVDNKLAGLQMGFPSNEYKKLSEILERQYGPPDEEEETDWKTRLGAVIDIKMVTWRTPHGEMRLRSRGVAQDAGTLSLLETKAQQRFDDLRYKQIISTVRPPLPPLEPPGQERSGE